MTEPIEPLTGSDCDLRDFPFMPLDVVRLRDSDISAISKGDEFRCAVLLWCASWHQVPAASIPDDDVILSQLAGFGRVVKEWKKVRSGALRGWVKCSDGRLYHPVVAEKANEAWTSRLEYRERKEAERLRKAAERDRRKREEDEARRLAESKQAVRGSPQDKPDLSAGQTEDVRSPSAGSPAENALIGRGTGTGTGTVEKDSGEGQGQWTVDRDSGYLKSSGDTPMPDDSPPPHDVRGWIEFYRDEYGVEIDAHSAHDRKKFWPLAQLWVNSCVTKTQMRQAITKARNDSKEAIAFLPSYADRVLASLNREKTPAVNKQEQLERRNQEVAERLARAG